MADDDDIKPSQDEDEFQFTEIDEPDPFSPEEPPSRFSSGALASHLNRQNLIILAGALILALAMYKLWGVFTAPSKPKPVPAGVVKPATVIPQPVVAPTPPITSQQENLNREKINALETNVATLANTMSGMQQSLESIRTQLGEILNTLKEQQAQIDALKPKPKPKIIGEFCPPMVVKKKPQPERFYIKAVVSGRAWLITAKGRTVSVALGDVVPGYGKVVAISPVNSTVTTSSGTIIRFRLNVSTTSSPYI